MVIDHSSKPRSTGAAVFPKQQDVKLSIIDLPDRARLRCFSPVHQIVELLVGAGASMRQRSQIFRQLPDEVANHPLAWVRFPD